MIQLYSNLPTLDLHGTDRDYARVLINDFIKEKTIEFDGNKLSINDDYDYTPTTKIIN